ncbi:hypothetical protein CROQUDRAFT_21492, partial [Cronartium quercuum f. sp. fusiforme G11]
DLEISQLEAEAEVPQLSNLSTMSKHTTDARLMLSRPRPGRAHTTLLPCSNMTFSGCGSMLYPIGVFPTPIVFPHPQGNTRIQAEFVVIENAK